MTQLTKIVFIGLSISNSALSARDGIKPNSEMLQKSTIDQQFILARWMMVRALFPRQARPQYQCGLTTGGARALPRYSNTPIADGTHLMATNRTMYQ
jgi:hypothetical protein